MRALTIEAREGQPSMEDRSVYLIPSYKSCMSHTYIIYLNKLIRLDINKQTNKQIAMAQQIKVVNV